MINVVTLPQFKSQWMCSIYVLLAVILIVIAISYGPIILSWRSVHVMTYYLAMYDKYKYNTIVVRIMRHISWLNLFRYVINVTKCHNYEYAIIWLASNMWICISYHYSSYSTFRCSYLYLLMLTLGWLLHDIKCLTWRKTIDGETYWLSYLILQF